MKLEYFAVGFVVIAIGVGGFYYMDTQLNAQMASYQAGGELLQSSEMMDLMEKIRIALLVTALVGVGVAGFGATGRRKSRYSTTLGQGDSAVNEKVFCRYCGMPGSLSGYCAGCGQGRQISSSILRRCIHCGRNASDDSMFCTSCGWKF